MTSLDQKHYHANFFLSGKAIGQRNPGGFLRGLLDIRVHGAIHDFWQPRRHEDISKTLQADPVTWAV